MATPKMPTGRSLAAATAKAQREVALAKREQDRKDKLAEQAKNQRIATKKASYITTYRASIAQRCAQAAAQGKTEVQIDTVLYSNEEDSIAKLAAWDKLAASHSPKGLTYQKRSEYHAPQLSHDEYESGHSFSGSTYFKLWVSWPASNKK